MGIVFSEKGLAVVLAGCVWFVASAAPRPLDEDQWPDVKPDYVTFVQPDDSNPGIDALQRVVCVERMPSHLRSGEKATFSYLVEGACPSAPMIGFFRFCGKFGQFWKERVRLTEKNVVRVSDESWRLTFEYSFPLYFNSGEYEVVFTLSTDGTEKGVVLSTPRKTVSVERLALVPGWEKPTVSEVRDLNGAPELFVNGRPVYVLNASESRRNRADTGSVSSAPYSFVTVGVDSRRFNPEVGVFNPTEFDRAAELMRREYPHAAFIVEIIAYPPSDWGKAHPDDVVRNEKGELSRFWGGTVTAYSFASTNAAAYLCDQFRSAIGYCESAPYANRIVGYRLSSGDTYEWLGFPTFGDDAAVDFSPVSIARFREWARTRYPQLGPDVLPAGYKARRALDNGDILWDQGRHLSAIAYQEFYSEANAEFLIACGRAAKAAVGGRKVVGAYHGYTFFLNSTGCSHERCHFGFKQILDSKALDFVLSPQSYGMRRPGGPYTDMKPFASIRNHGMLCICENDTRTSHGACLPPYLCYGQLPTEYLSVSSVRRDIATELCRRNPFLHLNTGGTDYFFPEMEETLRKARRTGNHLLATGAPLRRAEIALVVSEKSITSLPIHWRLVDNGELRQSYETNGTVSVGTDRRRNIFSGETLIYALEKWSRLGAPVDYVLGEDLADNPGDYKLYVFLHDLKCDEPFVSAVSKIRERGATMLWIYAPGWAKGAESSVELMRELTGIRFERVERPILAGVNMTDGTNRYMGTPTELVTPMFRACDADEVLGRYSDGTAGAALFRQGRTTAVFSGAWQLDMPFIRSVARRAGAFTYVDSGDPTEANEKLFTLHARFAGRKHVRLPKKTSVLSVFDNRIVARDVESFEFDADLHSTHLFYLADDVDELSRKLAHTTRP